MRSTSAVHGKENIEAALGKANSFPNNILETNEDVHMSALLFMFTPYQSGKPSGSQLMNGKM